MDIPEVSHPYLQVRQNAKRWRSAQALQMIAEVTAEEADAPDTVREGTPSSMQETAPRHFVMEVASQLMVLLNSQAPLVHQR